MKYLLDNHSLPLLRSLTFTKSLFAFDFDGTLSPIVNDPLKAQMSSKTRQLLKTLAAKVQVGVLSGRSLADLTPKIEINGILLVGNHGLEGLDSKISTLSSAARTNQSWKKNILSSLQKIIHDNGIFVEDKSYSLALHYRHSRNKIIARKNLLELATRLSPSPRIIMGKSVINLLPSGAPHKGVALLEMMVKTSSNAALYIGDDDTDEDVFALPDERIIGVRIGKKTTSLAQFYLNRQNEINSVLQYLVNQSGEA